MGKVTRYLIIVVTVLSILGLIAWYSYLQTRTDTTTERDTARGIGEEVPTFTGSTGSTYQNVMTDLTGGTVVAESQPAGSVSQIWHASLNPAAGVGFALEGNIEKLYFVERATGYIFLADHTKNAVTRVTNTLLPKIYEADFGGKAGVALRSLTDSGRITTYTGTIPSVQSTSSTSPQTLRTSQLDLDILALSMNSKTQGFFFILNDPNAGPVGITTDATGGNRKRIFASGILGWQPLFLSDGKTYIVQNPADGVAGSAYEVTAGAMRPVVTNVPGLTFLPQASSERFIYGSAGGALALYAKTTRGGEAVLLPVRTTADKCVWAHGTSIVYCAVPTVAPTGNYILSRSLGELHIADAWWKIDVADGSSELIFSSQRGSLFDVERPVISANNSVIAFLNGADKSVWVLRLTK